MSGLAMTLGLGAVALFGRLAAPVAASADEHGSSEVTVTVQIAPRLVDPPITPPVDCATVCIPGLPATGGDVATAVVWTAIALIVAGTLIIVWRSEPRRTASPPDSPPQRAYDDVSGHIVRRSRTDRTPRVPEAPRASAAPESSEES